MNKAKWVLDPTHSELGFKIKHLMISNVSGSFTKFDVETDSEENSFENAKVMVKIDVKSINTNNQQRDQHLLASDFFEAEKHPFITFESQKFEKLNGDNYHIHGNLSIKDQSHPIVLAAEYSGTAKDPWGNIKAGFTVSGKLNRKDWGMNFNAALETGGVMLGEEVKIHAEIQLAKQA